MNDWADDAIARLRKRSEDQRIRDEKFLETQKLKKVKGIPLWNEVKRIVRENAEAFNKKAGEDILRFHPSGDDQLIIAAELERGVRHLNATFDKESGVLNSVCGEAKRDSWSIVIDNNGEAHFRWNLVPTTPASIGKQMLDALLFG